MSCVACAYRAGTPWPGKAAQREHAAITPGIAFPVPTTPVRAQGTIPAMTPVQAIPAATTEAIFLPTGRSSAKKRTVRGAFL